jgi:hypothetical protein
MQRPRGNDRRLRNAGDRHAVAAIRPAWRKRALRRAHCIGRARALARACCELRPVQGDLAHRAHAVALWPAPRVVARDDA